MIVLKIRFLKSSSSSKRPLQKGRTIFFSLLLLLNWFLKQFFSINFCRFHWGIKKKNLSEQQQALATFIKRSNKFVFSHQGKKSMECKKDSYQYVCCSAITKKRVTENPTRQLYYIIILNNSTRAMEIFFFILSQNYYRHRSIFCLPGRIYKRKKKETDMKLCLYNLRKLPLSLLVFMFHNSSSE